MTPALEELKKPAVLCAGRLYCDLIFTDLPRLPSLGTEVYAGGFGAHAGGGAAITAAHLSALGHRSCLAAVLPGAPFDPLVVGDLTQAGVDLRFCGAGPVGLDPQLTVALTSADDRAFVTRRSGPALLPLSASDIIGFGALHVHIGELATLVEQPTLLQAARAAGATISLDCAWDETLGAEDIGDLVSEVDVFLPNAAEADHLRRIGVPEPFAPLTILKRGADGASAIHPSLHAPAERVGVVDTTGAGDAFNAGFLTSWLAGLPLIACLKAGNAQGAAAVARRGGIHAALPLPPADRPTTVAMATDEH